ncbi:MAG: hypothetical protein AABZ67_08790 [Pseudomonadota bacterium]
MARRFGWLWPALILLMGAGYQYLIHSAVAGGQIGAIYIVLPFLPLLVLAWWIVTRARNKLLWSFILLAAGTLIYVLEHQVRWGLAAAHGIPHAVIYLSLLWFFGRSLWHGDESLVTRLARSVHGTLPPELAAYSRRVTYAWCVFFAMQLVVSVLLFKFASLGTWSLFINVLNFPLLALMFTGEYGYRIIRHPEFPQASLIDGIRAFSNDTGRSTGANIH